MNPDGLRDDPIGPKNGRFRLLFLGDSVAVWGDSVEDTFVRHLRNELHRDPAFRNVDVINAGQKAFTNYQQLVYLKKYGLKFQPDLVGVQFCLNDRHKFFYQVQFENGRVVLETRGGNWLERVARRSRVLHWAGENVTPSQLAAMWKAWRGFSFDYRPDISNAWQDEPWNDIEHQLREMVELGRQNRFSVFVVAVPLAVQYRADYLERDRHYVLRPQRRLKEICERRGIPYFDLYPDLKVEMFLDDGMHLSRMGRREVGRQVAKFLKNSKLLPAGGQ